MATIAQGILGGFSGKVGTVVGAIWKGIATMRAYNPNVSNPNSPAQMEHRAKFKTIVQFLRPFCVYLRTWFSAGALKMTAFNAAVKYNLDHAIKGIYPAFEVDYTKVLLSQGQLVGAVNAAAVSVLPTKVDFSWDNNSGQGNALASDKAILILYDPLSQHMITDNTSLRGAGTGTLTTPESFSGHQVQAYIAFISDRGDVVADSSYIAPVLVA